jgi:hypothetical protein
LFRSNRQRSLHPSRLDAHRERSRAGRYVSLGPVPGEQVNRRVANARGARRNQRDTHADGRLGRVPDRSCLLVVRRCLLLVIAGLVAACSEPVECTPSLVFGIQVLVRDARTDAFVAQPVHGVVRDGAFEDSLRVVSSAGTDSALATVLAGAAERPGTYSVHLESAGYEPWDTANVRVTKGECHVRPASLTARLNLEAAALRLDGRWQGRRRVPVSPER